MTLHRKFVRAVALSAGLLLGSSAWAGTFTDSFESGASPSWGNNFGGWVAAGGVYSAGNPSNFPGAASALPWVLDDFSLEFDVNDVQDGGVWLRSSAAPGSIGRVGVLLVTGVGGGLYWHVVTDGGNYGASLGAVGGLFTPGVSDPHFKVDVSGSTYSVYVDGGAVPVAVLNSGAFASGQVALYDYSAQTFDNVVLSGTGVLPVPEPEAWVMLIAGLGVLGTTLRRRKHARRQG